MRFSVYGLRFAVCGLRFAVCGLRFTVCGLRFAVYGLRFAVCGLRFEVCGGLLPFQSISTLTIKLQVAAAAALYSCCPTVEQAPCCSSSCSLLCDCYSWLSCFSCIGVRSSCIGVRSHSPSRAFSGCVARRSKRSPARSSATLTRSSAKRKFEFTMGEAEGRAELESCVHHGCVTVECDACIR